MQRAMVLAGVVALVMARPELYKEKEDFQFSRSSSDDGTKSGFYGAQRGNMGGNYERAHNMDALAQHQMGGLVKTVQGELGDGANQRSGSVFTAANSRGMYGSGNYDLSNLEGRNFQEGTTFGDSKSQSQSYSASHNAGYSGQYSSANSASYGSNAQRSQALNSRYYSGYDADNTADQALYSNSMQNSENLQATKQNERHNTAENSGYYSQSGQHDRSTYGQSAAGSHSSNGYGSVRLVNSGPARVYVRPGGRVSVPVAAHLYEDSRSSSIDQNAINTETESLTNGDQQTIYKPTNNGKHYESSYRYRKEWEKHSSNPVGVPLAVPTVNPYNSELYEETQKQGYEQEARGHEAQSAHSSHQHSGYSSASSTAYDSEHQRAMAGSATKSNTAHSDAYTHGAYNHGSSASSASNYNGISGNLNNQVEDIGTKPKSYQSSYSYHKSWERQGDPYIIQPSTNGQYYMADGQTSQRLTSSSSNHGYSGSGTNQYYHHGHHAHSSSAGEVCDENGHVRVARSYNSYDQQGQNVYDGQQSQNTEDFGQQPQNLQNFEQEPQNLQEFGQQSQNLEDFGQQSQKMEDFGQQSQNLEDFGQQSQRLEDLGQQSQNLEDFGQQSQKMEDLEQSQNLEDFGQQSQKMEDLGQQSQNIEDFGQQSQKIEDLGQQSQNLEDFGQQSQNLEDFGQQTQNAGQLTQNQWDQQSQTDLGQETQNTWHMLETLQNQNQPKYFGEQVIETNKQSFSTPVESESHNTQIPQTALYNSDKQLIQPAFTVQETQKAQDNVYWNQQSSNVFSSGGPLNNQPYMPHNLWSDHYNQFNTGFGAEVQPQQFYPMNYNNNNYFHHTYGSGSSSNSYANTNNNAWAQGNSYYSSHYNNGYSTPTSSNSPLSSLWDKLDNIEKQTISQGESGAFESNQKNQESMQNSNISELQTIINNGFHELNATVSTDKVVSPTTLPSTTQTNGIDKTTKKTENVGPQEKERGDIEPEKQPRDDEDVGRGDIGPDDSTSDSINSPSKPLEIFEIKPSKIPEDVGTFSLTKVTTPSSVLSTVQNDKITPEHDLSVISLNEQKLQEHDIQRADGSASSTPKISYGVQPHTPEEVQVQNTDNHFNLGQETQNFDQENFNQFEDFSQQNIHTDQQHVTHQLVDFGQQNENVDHQKLDFGQQSINADQQNVDQLVDFGQQNMNVDQQNQEHQIADFGQKRTNVSQEIVDFGQQNVNQADFGQEDDTQQASLKEFVKDESDQGQEGQQLQNWGQQNENLKMEDLNQREHNLNLDTQRSTQQVETFAPITVNDKEERGQKLPVVEPQLVTQKTTSVEAPLEPTTEKPGFWKRTKDKVTSWFSRS